MPLLTDQAWQSVLDLARRYGVSPDAVTALLHAVSNGGGSMAQFHIGELGGGGQWMRGGMTMVGDMFNHGLKAKVDGLCAELSNLLASGNPFVPPPAPAGGGYGFGFFGGGGNWWPSDLGSPNGSGSSNGVRYAYFANSRRLAVDDNGRVTVYDTLDHQIGGVSQQQGSGSSLTFSSQYGPVSLASLPVVSGNAPPAPPPPQQSANPPPQQGAAEGDITAKFEQLATLKQRGFLTEEEYAAKKAELLKRM